MPLSISNFKRRLRLPTVFFRRPSREEQIHGGPPLEFIRPIPEIPWRGITVGVVLVVVAAVTAWELYCRSIGYGPTLNDNEDLWTSRRRAVRPESLVIVGDSRPLFDLDLDELEHGFGKRPIQLALAGSSAYPVLADLANDESFHGTIICSFVPALFLAHRRWILEKKRCTVSITKPLRNAPASISPFRWRNILFSSNRKISHLASISVSCVSAIDRARWCRRSYLLISKPWTANAAHGCGSDALIQTAHSPDASNKSGSRFSRPRHHRVTSRSRCSWLK